jgi:hypothetical protein
MTHFLRFLSVFVAAVAIAGCGSVSIAPEDVTGTIVDITRAPWPGRQVLVGDTLTTTDEAGHFTVHNVSPPYDLAIADPIPWGEVYVGMTDPAPTVVSRGLAPGTQHGSMTLTVVLPAADTSTLLGWVVVEATDNVTKITAQPVTTAPGPVRTYNVDWVGSPSAEVRIRAFQTQVDPATSAPVHYLGYDTTDLVLDDKGNVTWNASYKPPPFSESPLSVTVSLPEGYAISHTWLRMGSTDQFGTAGWIGSGAAGPEISLVVPDLPGAPFELDVTAGDGYAVSRSYVPGLPAGTQKLAVQVEPAPTVISPPDGATLGVGSTITWTLGGPGAPYTELDVTEGKGQSIFLYGGDGSVTVPDLSALGLPLPHGEPCLVTVFRASWATTVEDFASPDYASALSQKPSTSGFSKASAVTTR